MTSSNTLKKIVSIGASLMLAIGGSLVATEAAHATGPSATTNIVGGTAAATDTVRMVATFPAMIMDGQDQLDLAAANSVAPMNDNIYGSQGDGGYDAQQEYCDANNQYFPGQDPTGVEINLDQSGPYTCMGNTPSQATTTGVSRVGSSGQDLIVTTDFFLGGNIFYIGSKFQLISTALYIGPQGRRLVSIAVPVTIVAPLTNLTVATVDSSSAEITYSTTYSDGPYKYLVRLSSAPVSSLSDILTTGNSGTSANWPGKKVRPSGLNASTAYALDMVLLDQTSQTPSAASAIASINFTTTAPPATRPGAVRNITTTAGVGEITVSWTAPASDGGSAVTGYTVKRSPFPGNYQNAVQVNGSTLSTTITGLDSWQQYYFEVTATNAVGDNIYPEYTNFGTSPLAQQVQTYTLTFDLQGGSFDPNLNLATTYPNYSSGQSVNISNLLIAYDPFKSGYIFNGWYSMPILGVELSNVTITGDTTVYAQWTAQQQQQQPSGNTLTLDLQGGAISGPETVSGLISATTNIASALGGRTPTRSGYSFDGWKESLNGSFVSIVNMATGNKTIYAAWSSNVTQGIVYSNCAGQSTMTAVSISQSSMPRTGTFVRTWNNTPGLNECLIPAAGSALATYVNGVALAAPGAFGLSTAFIARSTAVTLVAIENTLGRQLVAGDVITYKYWLGLSAAPTTETPNFTVTLNIVGNDTPSVVAPDPSVDATDVAAEPLPVWASNIIQSIPTLTKRLIATGGSVALTGADHSDLKSVTIGGKDVAHKLEANGHITIPVPAGEAGKTADIVIVFSGGTMVVQDAIKYVAPIDVAKIGERPIAIAAGAKRITSAVADQIRQAAFANMTNNTISCVAYAANNTAKAKAAAKLIAVQACGIATKANPGLKAADITVIVNKTKAKKEAVGIKVYKADN